MIRTDQAAAPTPQAVNTERCRHDTPKENDLHCWNVIDEFDENVGKKKGDRREEHRPHAGGKWQAAHDEAVGAELQAI